MLYSLFSSNNLSWNVSHEISDLIIHLYFLSSCCVTPSASFWYWGFKSEAAARHFIWEAYRDSASLEHFLNASNSILFLVQASRAWKCLYYCLSENINVERRHFHCHERADELLSIEVWSKENIPRDLYTLQVMMIYLLYRERGIWRQWISISTRHI